jgi:purine-binding chemotaxis protein CheW
LGDSDRQLLVFSLYGEHYGVPIGVVREIIRYTPPGATAAASGVIQGMISWRGRVLPIVDLSSRIGRNLEVDEKTRILVLELANGSLGLIVAGVHGLQSIPETQIESLPVAASDLGDQIAAVGERLIMLIDPERALGSVLPSPPAKAAPAAPRRRTTTRRAR